MRIATFVVFFSASLFMAAQDTTTKIRKVPVTPTSAAFGKEMFGAYCASCHGLDGKGAGPAVVALNNRPSDLTALARTNHGKFPAALVISSIQDGATGAHGSKDMPVWGPILSSVSADRPLVIQERLTNLTSFIESLQSK